MWLLLVSATQQEPSVGLTASAVCPPKRASAATGRVPVVGVRPEEQPQSSKKEKPRNKRLRFILHSSLRARIVTYGVKGVGESGRGMGGGSRAEYRPAECPSGGVEGWIGDAGQSSARQSAIGGRPVVPQAPSPLRSPQGQDSDEGDGLGAWFEEW